ncbi:MAG TPA: hypothetical protein PKW80_01955 [Bacteroidales bacterium]|nr:hypothetical protein [Bacteroidales bacterium]
MNYSCNTTKTSRSFTIGKGGGFTGRYDIYRVCENGSVYLVRDDMTEELLMKAGKKEIAGIFCQFDKLNITGTTFSHPGNMTSFILYTLDGKTYEIKWGSPNAKPPQQYVDFFDKVWSLIRRK